MAMQRKMMEINVYSMPDCPKCTAAKEFLTANGLTFTEHNIIQDRQATKDFIIKTGQKQVPVVDIDGELVFGFDQEKLEELLGL